MDIIDIIFFFVIFYAISIKRMYERNLRDTLDSITKNNQITYDIYRQRYPSEVSGHDVDALMWYDVGR